MSDKEFEEFKWKHERQERAAERAHDLNDAHATQINEATIQAGQLTLRMSMLVNGGAAVAVLAFLGSLASKDRFDITQLNQIASPIIWFAIGVAASVSGLALAYLTNYCHVTYANSLDKAWEHPYLIPSRSSKFWDHAGSVFHVLALLAAIASIALFIYGMVEVRDALLSLKAPST
jgi:hypothetical protein